MICLKKDYVENKLNLFYIQFETMLKVINTDILIHLKMLSRTF